MSVDFESGRNPVSKDQVQPDMSVEVERADAGRDGRTHLPKLSDANGEQGEKNVFPCSAGHEQRIGSLTRLIHTALLLLLIGITTLYLVPLSLRNLVLGYECGRVFSAGVGPGSPSRDAANWLPSRLSLSVETRRRYDWLRMVLPGTRLFRAPIWCPSGGWRHARGREHCRGEPGSSLSGGYAPDSARAEGSSIVDEPGEG